MNRKEFFKKLGLGLGVAIVAPKIIGKPVTYKKRKQKVKVTAINSKKNYTDGLLPKSNTPSIFTCRKPCLKDRVVDKKGNIWTVKGRENRQGYGPPDRTRIILAPVSVNPDIHGMKPIRQSVDITYFNKNFTIILCINEYQRK